MKTRARDTVAVLFDEFEVLDVAGPLQVLGQAGRIYNFRPFRIRTVGARRGPVPTRSQLSLDAQACLEEAGAPEILLVPGGYGARRALQDAALLPWLREAVQGAEAVLAVGLGVLLVGATGALDGRDAAAPASALELFAEHAPRVRALPAIDRVTDGRVLTARGGAAAIDAALDLTARLLGEKLARAVAADLGSSWSGPPEHLRIA